MATSWRTTIGALLVTALGGGCIAADPLEETRAGILGDNGSTLNGPVLNGRHLNGGALNGRKVNGRKVNGPSFNGLFTSGGALFGTTGDGALARIAAGDTLSASLDDGSSLDISVVATRDSTIRTVNGFAETEWKAVSYYQLSYQSPDDGGTYDYCPNGLEAVPMAGRWDPGTGYKFTDDPDEFTFACMGYALGKCFELGYVPVLEVGFDRSNYYVDDRNEQLHQSCVRALRADYCGNGTPHTIDGMVIDVSDQFGVQAAEGDTVMESRWTENGATCLSDPRLLRREDVECAELPTCGSQEGYFSGGLLTIGLPRESLWD